MTRYVAPALSLLLGLYVVLAELTYRGRPSELTPILLALGVGIALLAAGQIGSFVESRQKEAQPSAPAS